MPSSFRHLKERKLFQWGLAYLAGAWALLQVVGFLAEQFDWPPAVARSTTILLAVGFFAALVLTWYHGEQGRQNASGPELLMLAALLVLAGVGVALLGREPVAQGSDQRTAATPLDAPPTLDRRRIAVLPVRNSSPGDEQCEMLALGFHDDVISRLSGIRELRVISRQSVMDYRDDTRSIPQIGRELGAGAVLESGVQCVGAQVRVTPRLVDAARDELLWSEPYDRTWSLDALFAIQSEIAERVADALLATLTSEERASVATRPTQNEEAYRLYVQAREHAFNVDLEETETAIALLEDAVELDEDFAEAWAWLSRSETRIYWLRRSPEQLERARRAAERALALEPESPEAHRAMAWYHYQGHLDYENATLEFERVLRLSPGDPDAQQGLAAVRRRQGRFEEALEGFYAVADADPRNQQVFVDIASSLDLLGRHDEAHSTYRAALALDPSSVGVLEDVAYSRLLAGDLEGASSYVGRVSDPLSASTYIPNVSVFLERVAGRQQSLLLGLDRVERPLLVDFPLRVRPVDLIAGDLLIDLGRPDAARQRFASAARLLEDMRSADSEDPRVHAALGVAYASLGREDDALRSARAAVEIMPVQREALRGAAMLDELARTYTRIGDHNAALDTLERLFALQNSQVITPALARMDPDWTALRRDPRFEALLARVERGR